MRIAYLVVGHPMRTWPERLPTTMLHQEYAAPSLISLRLTTPTSTELSFWPNAGMRALQAQIDELWEMVKTLSTLFEDQRVGFVEAISHFNLSSAHDVLAKNWRKDL